MDRLIYTAVSGMASSMVHQRMIASNMANAQTIGFRAEVMEFTPMTLDGPSLEVRALNSSQVHGALMKAGSLVQTRRDLDIAMRGCRKVNHLKIFRILDMKEKFEFFVMSVLRVNFQRRELLY